MDEAYKKWVQEAIEKLKAAGVKPCEIHAWQSMNKDGTCEACKKEDFPDDFLGTE